MHVFASFGADLHAPSVISDEISASELRRKFVRSARCWLGTHTMSARSLFFFHHHHHHQAKQSQNSHGRVSHRQRKKRLRQKKMGNDLWPLFFARSDNKTLSKFKRSFPLLQLCNYSRKTGFLRVGQKLIRRVYCFLIK